MLELKNATALLFHSLIPISVYNGEHRVAKPQ
uniref:Uncharacterized protein n=1 Tax=Anguilla anguilla TaxID=7936 RepID=A0A0E9RMD1_ANGAN